MSPSNILYLLTFFYSLDLILTNKTSCEKEDYRFVYTSCDEENNRWRVAIPIKNCSSTDYVPPPILAKKCDFSCKAGSYLNIESERCEECEPGTYSLGGGVRFDDWEGKLPTQFKSIGNCSESWSVKDGYLVGEAGECSSILKLEMLIVRSGYISFSYSFDDLKLLARFQIESGNCDIDDAISKYLRATETDNFKRTVYKLKPGQTNFYWTLFNASKNKKDKKIIRIQSIEVFGVPYESSCSPCKAGSYSDRSSSTCNLCPINSYSKRSASKCTSCTSHQYSYIGSGKCEDRKACTSNDYFSYYAPCVKQQTQLLSNWSEPRICDDEMEGAFKLPPPSSLQPCPPCNLGQQLINSSCIFCPRNYYANDATASICLPCSPNMKAINMISIQQWSNLPRNINITSQCLEGDDDTKCVTRDGWYTPSADMMQSRLGNDPSTYLSLIIRTSGFNPSENNFHRRSRYDDDNYDEDDRMVTATGSISFVFELDCKGDCTLYFTEKVGKNLEIIEQWKGFHDKTYYTYDVHHMGNGVYSWTFQQGTESVITSLKDEDNDVIIKDVARIFSINMTNVVVGGAAECSTCPLDAHQNNCVECDDGSYMDETSKKCIKCERNTWVKTSNSVGHKSCIECGPGLKHYKHKFCFTDCTYNSSTGLLYDFNPLSRNQLVKSPYLFTSSGYKYQHVFNVSLCSDLRQLPNKPLATCKNNFTSDDFQEHTEDDIIEYKESMCRITLLPSEKSQPISANPISFSKDLLGVTDDASLLNIQTYLDAANFNSTTGILKDIYFVYKSNITTKVCPNGRSSIVVMRCDPEVTIVGGLASLPQSCPDGTCDGCNFILLLTSHSNCPICTVSDFHEYKEECINGMQQIILKTKKESICYVGNSLAQAKTIACSLIWNKSWPLWLKLLMILVPVFILSGIILLIVTCYCWIKNKNLQYKYMKLVASSGLGGLEGEMEGADSCALDEGEEDEQFDAVQFKNKNSYFKKYKKGLRSFEGISMDEKASLT